MTDKSDNEIAVKLERLVGQMSAKDVEIINSESKYHKGNIGYQVKYENKHLICVSCGYGSNNVDNSGIPYPSNDLFNVSVYELLSDSSNPVPIVDFDNPPADEIFRTLEKKYNEHRDEIRRREKKREEEKRESNSISA